MKKLTRILITSKTENPNIDSLSGLSCFIFRSCRKFWCGCQKRWQCEAKREVWKVYLAFYFVETLKYLSLLISRNYSVDERRAITNITNYTVSLSSQSPSLNIHSGQISSSVTKGRDLVPLNCHITTSLFWCRWTHDFHIFELQIDEIWV